ncbi:cobalt-precorrin-6A reductase [Telmatospirillum sp. J64-1]|uniref:cobalt-precorrin-6A reductase n=1 Tax=Telmatospirillum sp. J64-1 TaxID=2502183 RepID=UPI00115C8862|nr:cobalt-precorrin-6A reductase [Telmatospirillum sp. J64-1]
MPGPETRPALLILGGTTEGAELARVLHRQYAGRLRIVSSLAGRVERPGPLPGEVRIGGFGGPVGLAQYMRENGITMLVDATHPFATAISAHARQACDILRLPRLTLERPAWQRQPGDIWVEVDDMEEAARLLPRIGQRAFLTVGTGEIEPFAKSEGVWFLVRLIAPPKTPLPLEDYQVTLGRGPFSIDDERSLLSSWQIDCVVTKASGGFATYGKIIAARELRLPVLMIRRPDPEPGERVSSIDGALGWVRQMAGM